MHLTAHICKLLLVTACLTNTIALASPVIKYVYDGDTVKIQDGDRQYKLRISDIDAPERNQQYGKQARRALTKLCKHAEISVQLTGIDKYQRDLGYLTCNNTPVSAFMVNEGHAWFNVRYSSNPHLKVAEEDARYAKRGLWKQHNPTPPWTWRQKHMRN